MNDIHEQPTAPTTTQPMSSTTSVKDFMVPISIIIAGAFVGAGLYFGNTGNTTTPQVAAEPAAQEQPTAATEKIDPITDEDFVKGSPDAPIKIVEYSDFDCPFCSRFHDTMNEIVAESDGQVNWVFRHFPLEQLHPNAFAVSLSAECVAEQGGDEAFWQFTDAYFAERGAGNRTPHGELIPELVLQTGVDQQQFTECFNAERYAENIQADIADAVETGGRGTPWSVLIGPTGKTYPINGAQPRSVVEQIINLALEEA